MDLSIETITPKMAEKYLRFNTSNRTFRKTLVEQYVRDMKSGAWRLTHQGIAFNCDGTLLDGQHRLQAIVDSGVTVQMLVARGVASETQLAMDDHAKRSAGDALTLARGELVTPTDVAVVRAAVELQSREYSTHATKGELNVLLDKFADGLEFVSVFLVTKQRGVTAAPVWGAILLAWYYVDDLDRLSSFCRILAGAEMPTGDCDRVAQVLREWLLRTGFKGGAMRQEAYKKTQRAIVAFMKRQRIDKLFGNNVYFQWPLVNPVRNLR